MLRLLLDEHISSKVVLGLKRQLPLADVECILTWQDGEHLGSPDDVILLMHYEIGVLWLPMTLRRCRVRFNLLLPVTVNIQECCLSTQRHYAQMTSAGLCEHCNPL